MRGRRPVQLPHGQHSHWGGLAPCSCALGPATHTRSLAAVRVAGLYDRSKAPMIYGDHESTWNYLDMPEDAAENPYGALADVMIHEAAED